MLGRGVFFDVTPVLATVRKKSNILWILLDGHTSGGVACQTSRARAANLATRPHLGQSELHETSAQDDMGLTDQGPTQLQPSPTD